VPDGSITIAGLGIHAARHPTVEVLESLRSADCVLHSVAGASVREWIQSLARTEEDLNRFYRDGAPRLEAYRAMADRAISLAKDGRSVVFAVYGHPCVLHTGVQLTLQDAARQNIRTRVLPGVSTIDGLLAAIGVDPGYGGLHMLEASDMVRFGRVPQTRGHVLILQVAITGSRLHARVGHHGERAEPLLRRLAALYPPAHPALHFRLQTNDHEETLRWTEVGRLRLEDWSDASSLYLPPLHNEDVDGGAALEAGVAGAGPNGTAIAVDSAGLAQKATSLIGFLSRALPEGAGVPALVCLGPEASIIGSAAAARMPRDVDLLVPASAGRLGGRVRGPVVMVVDGPAWPEGTTSFLRRIEDAAGPVAGVAVVHEPHDRTLVERLSASGCPATALVQHPRTGDRGQDESLRPVLPGDLDERGTRPVLVRSPDGGLTQVQPSPWSSWPALAQLNGVRRAAQLYPPAEPSMFRSDAAPRADPFARASLPGNVAAPLRRTVLGAEGAARPLAVELERSLPASRGLGIAVYVSGRQVACRVCVNTRDVDGLARTIETVRDEVRESDGPGPDAAPPVVLLSVLGQPRVTTPAAVTDRTIRLAEDTLIARGQAGPAFILAHVPTYMNWTARQALAALEQKAASRAVELWLAPTQTLWIRVDGAVEDCTGGLPDRCRGLQTLEAVSDEIELVARHLSGLLEPDLHIAGAYYPRVDITRGDGSRARKAIALAALLRAEDPRPAGASDRAAAALAGLADEVWRDAGAGDGPAQVMEQAHALLAMATSPPEPAFERLIPSYAERLQGCLDSEGRVRADLRPSAAEQPYLPGVLLTALATCRPRLGVELLSGPQLEAAVGSFRGRFTKSPSWPEVWWQLRAWSAVQSSWPDPRVAEFLGSMVDWVGRHQLASGAFLTWDWATAPSFQTACVAEAVVQAAHALEDASSPERRAETNRMVARALEFCSSLVVDDRHADLWPVPARAVGGIRTWHGGIELRSDAAGHYLHALLDHRRALTAGGGPG
jgi:hypothetical protein